MKKLIFISATVLFIALETFAQDSFPNNFPANISQKLRYEVYGVFKTPIKKEKLLNVKSLSDFINDYPKNWIDSYGSVEILATCNGIAMKATSSNDKLTVEQKNILNTVDMASDIIINVKYNYKDPLTNVVENNNMRILMTIVPEIQAEYLGGYQQLIKYLKEKTGSIIPEKTSNKTNVVIRFIVNEGGEISNTKISDTSGDSKTDKLLIDVINKMPKWKPAEDLKGIKIRQEFEFRIGNTGC